MTESKINGLVLIGGASSRMGEDKYGIMYREQSHGLWTYELIDSLVSETFFSVKKVVPAFKSYAQIKDQYSEKGPMVAILSAFYKFPSFAWLTIPTDLPYITLDMLKILIKQRAPDKLATTLKSAEKPYPEPLLCIWEPRAFPILLSRFQEGYKSPRQFLETQDVKIIEIEHSDGFFNANTPEDRDRVLRKGSDR